MSRLSKLKAEKGEKVLKDVTEEEWNTLAEPIVKEIINIKRLRGSVIHNFIDIEMLINILIRDYYVKNEKNDEFLENCMFDDYFNFGLKRRIFEKTFDNNFKKEFFQDLRRLSNIRNKIAHSPIIDFGGTLVYTDTNLRLKTKKVKELHDDFFRLHGKILKELNQFLEMLKVKEK